MAVTTVAPTPTPTPAPAAASAPAPVGQASVQRAAQAALNHPQVKNDVAIVQRYLGSSRGDRIGQYCDFIRDPKNRKLAIGLVVDSAFGAAVGAALGIAIGGGGATLAGFPAAAKPLAALGGTVGGCAGAALGARAHIVTFRYSEKFEEWKKGAVKTRVYEIFEKYLNEEQIIPFRCAYTLSLIKVPVVDEHGHLFEAEEIYANIRRHEELHPNKPFTCLHNTRPIRQLLFDPTYYRRVLAALKPLFDVASSDPAVVAGLIAYRQNAVENNRNVMMEELKPEFDHLLCGNLSEQEKKQAANALAERAGSLSEKYKVQ